MRLFEAGSRRDGPQVVHDRVSSLANLVTAMRLLGLLPFVQLLVHSKWSGAFALLLALSVMDFLDGYVARRLDQITRIGTLIDPLADRITVFTTTVALLIVDILPWWIAALIVSRDILALILLGAVFRGLIQRVTRISKAATAVLFAGMLTFLLGPISVSRPALLRDAAIILTSLGIVLYYIAGLQYVKAARAAWQQRRRPQ
jgi:cardiolipin synthase (CMP-forming)